MDMDFLSDPIFSDLGRSDFIEGIDNGAIDFENLERFMQVGPSDDNLPTTNSCNSENRLNLLDYNLKTEALTQHRHNNSGDINTSLSAIAGRTSFNTDTSTPLLTVGDGSAKMPDSPPDSGSEPPYSPLQDSQGLSLTSRDTNNGLPTTHQSSTLPEIRIPSQYKTTHQMQHRTYTQLYHSHTVQHSNNNSPPASPCFALDKIHIKCETGLPIEPSISPQQLSHSNSSNSCNISNNSHLELYPHQIMFINPSNNNPDATIQYENNNYGIYSTFNYPSAVMGDISIHSIPPSSEVSYLNDTNRVQLIGTSEINYTQDQKTSLPSTPVHLSSSRKRKLSTQLEYTDFNGIKPDPGLPICPSSSPIAAAELQQLESTSPVSINLPSNNSNISSPPAHSSASFSPTLSAGNSNPDNSLDGNNLVVSRSSDCVDSSNLTPCIRFTSFQPQNWHKLCDQNLQDVSVVYYRVDADKGFNFSVSDDAFVCQKKNHFQITCHARLQGDAKFVKTSSGLEKINSFHLHFYGVKLETPNQTIRVEQSQSDRSKKPFHPIPLDLQCHIVSKITVGRLHFSETTNNNMRKKGRPNPEQRYFQLVVGLHVHTISGNFPIISQGSERIIVRASNPGQFESDVELCWQRGLTQDSIFHTGRIGINTDRPDESLVVHGNLKVSGHIVQPSDSRAKQEIAELDTSVQLRNLQKIRIVRYRYAPEFAIHSGLKRSAESDTDEIVDTGVIAQEVREVIPDAVQEAGSIVLPNGNVIENFLLVNKDRILMENIGAVKELCKVTGLLENRIEDLERNNHLLRQQEFEQRRKKFRVNKKYSRKAGYEICTNKLLQVIILCLVIIMAACLAAVSTLYFVEHNKQSYNYKQLERLQFHSNGQLLGHDSVLFNEQEGYIVQVHNILSRNKTVSKTGIVRIPSHKNHTQSEFTYNESNDMLSVSGRNDELTVVMEKPLVNLQPFQSRKEAFRLTTTAPSLRINKTNSSKNKSKWPQAQVVPKLIASLPSSRTTNTFIFSAISSTPESKSEEISNINETSSEKITNSAHDFDNNSIDNDAQHISKTELTEKRSSIPTSTLFESGLSNIEDSIEATANSSSLIMNNVPDTTDSVYNLKSISIIHKTASPPSDNIYLTTNKVTIVGLQTNYSPELPPISNKSQGALEGALETSDSIDLQNLSNINEFANNSTTTLGFDFKIGHESSLGRRSTSQRERIMVQNKMIQVDIFGAPPHCIRKLGVEDADNCQSFCSENIGEKAMNENLDENYQHIVDSNISGTEGGPEATHFESLLINSSLNEYEKKLVASEVVKTSNAQNFEGSDTFEHASNSAEKLEMDTKKMDTGKSNLPQQHIRKTVETNQGIPLNCWEISSCIIANGLNQTFSLENFCPNIKKSLNVTYNIPLSKFFKESKVEIHLRSSVPLLWSICNERDYSKGKEKHLLLPPSHFNLANILQQQSTISKFVINIPRYGFFFKKLTLRAMDNSKLQNTCEAITSEENTLLQYNFSIVRHCD